jgi:hypothetical protein
MLMTRTSLQTINHSVGNNVTLGMVCRQIYRDRLSQ